MKRRRAPSGTPACGLNALSSSVKRPFGPSAGLCFFCFIVFCLFDEFEDGALFIRSEVFAAAPKGVRFIEGEPSAGKDAVVRITRAFVYLKGAVEEAAVTAPIFHHFKGEAFELEAGANRVGDGV